MDIGFFKCNACGIVLGNAFVINIAVWQAGGVIICFKGMVKVHKWGITRDAGIIIKEKPVGMTRPLMPCELDMVS